MTGHYDVCVICGEPTQDHPTGSAAAYSCPASDLMTGDTTLADLRANPEAIRLLGFALFNLNKGNLSATETLVRKAYKELAGREWDEV